MDKVMLRVWIFLWSVEKGLRFYQHWMFKLRGTQLVPKKKAIKGLVIANIRK